MTLDTTLIDLRVRMTLDTTLMNFSNKMRWEKTTLTLVGDRFHAYHGVGEQERLVGNAYTVDLRLEVDLSRAAQTDDLSDTVNYAAVHAAVSEEMAIPSSLLEHVAGRIARRILNDFPTIQSVDIRLTKRNPPMGADIDSAGVEMRASRS